MGSGQGGDWDVEAHAFLTCPDSCTFGFVDVLDNFIDELTEKWPLAGGIGLSADGDANRDKEVGGLWKEAMLVENLKK